MASAATSVASKLFSTVELAEMVFSSLSAADLSRLKRTCRQWVAVISSSTSKELKQALFLEPVPVDTVLVWDRSREVHNFLSQDQAHVNAQTRIAVGSLHPVFKTWEPRNEVSDTLATLIEPQKLEKFASETLKQSFVTQPPCQRVQISYGTANGETSGNCEVHKTEGVRVGDLLDELNRALERSRKAIRPGMQFPPGRWPPLLNFRRRPGTRYVVNEEDAADVASKLRIERVNCRFMGILTEDSPYVLGAKGVKGGRIRKSDKRYPDQNNTRTLLTNGRSKPYPPNPVR